MLLRRYLALLFLMVLPSLAGCLDSDPAGAGDELPRVLPEDETRLLRYSLWPSDAMVLEFQVSCDCRGEQVLLGWTFSGNWTAGAGANSVQQTNVRDGADADLFAAMVLRERDEPQQSPAAHVDIIRSNIMGVGSPGNYALMVSTGLAGSTEISMPSGSPGTAFVSFSQDFPLIVELDGKPLRLLFVATNGTGHRALPQLNLTLEVPSTANVTLHAGTTRAFAYDEPILEEAVGPALDLNYPQNVHARAFGESSREWNSKGPLLYTFSPWVLRDGAQDATYRIDTPDHSYRARLNYTNGQGGYQCLDGCDGLGGTYAVNAGIAPPGPTRFTVESAACATNSGCIGTMVGVDLGSLMVVSNLRGG